MNLLRALATVSSLTMVSRILGYARDFFIARIFGASLATDAFFVAFKIPNLLRRMFAEGAFSQAFVPILGGLPQPELGGGYALAHRQREHAALHRAGDHRRARHGGRSAHRLRHRARVRRRSRRSSRSRSSSCASPSRTSSSSPWWRSPPACSTPGTASRCRPSRRRCSTCRSSSARRFWRRISTRRSGCSRGRCSPAACCSSPSRSRSSRGSGCCRDGGSTSRTPACAASSSSWRPAAFGVSVSQVSLLINQVFASFLQTGSVSWLYYADRLMELPAGVLGVARGHHPPAQPFEVPRAGEPGGIRPPARLGPAHHRAPRRAERRRARGARACRSSARSSTTGASVPRMPG